ncbi:hypothetical protein O1611_g9946 [Lasiodiplodia mahajangana]|uniref:Uncharacterized protein n=1 Tax=Lasiodiplodia mahajangana TaxID=1108764 RepID=A0ACC2J3I5_9PEZI|nr:hypothetical protein O1611_g9946 [Lasiodiplodia mahajangana]
MRTPARSRPGGQADKNVTRPSASDVKRRCTSLHAWELPKQTGALAPAHVWTNKDMDPTPPEQQNWSIGSIVAYWATDVLNLSTWQTASAVLAVGLSWREAIPIMFLGNLAVAIPIVLNGAIGSKLHIPFSVVATSSFGFYLRYFSIVSRAVLAMFWLGIQVSSKPLNNPRFANTSVEAILTTTRALLTQRLARA